MKTIMMSLLFAATLMGTAMTARAEDKCTSCCKCEACKCAPCACCKCETCTCAK